MTKSEGPQNPYHEPRGRSASARRSIAQYQAERADRPKAADIAPKSERHSRRLAAAQRQFAAVTHTPEQIEQILAAINAEFE